MDQGKLDGAVRAAVLLSGTREDRFDKLLEYAAYLKATKRWTDAELVSLQGRVRHLLSWSDDIDRPASA